MSNRECEGMCMFDLCTKFHTSSSNGSSRPQKMQIPRRSVIIHMFQDSALNGASVIPTSQFRASAMLLLWVTGYSFVRCGGGIQRHNVYTKFRQNQSTASIVTRRLHGDLITSLSVLKKGRQARRTQNNISIRLHVY
jgi:hypothetical protein